MAKFQLDSSFTPQGDQPQAISALTNSLRDNNRNQVLLGVTGSGKTFTIANVIQELQRLTLLLAPNKTLAAQLYGEMKDFFPNNSVEYFVSYYDYYQPEAHVPRTDTYIEKEASINEQLDRMRHTCALLEKDDAIIVASVSCIYGIGGAETYSGMVIPLTKGHEITPQDLSRKLSEIQYKRNDYMLQRGTFRIKGDTFEIFPSAWMIGPGGYPSLAMK